MFFITPVFSIARCLRVLNGRRFPNAKAKMDGLSFFRVNLAIACCLSLAIQVPLEANVEYRKYAVQRRATRCKCYEILTRRHASTQEEILYPPVEVKRGATYRHVFPLKKNIFVVIYRGDSRIFHWPRLITRYYQRIKNHAAHSGHAEAGLATVGLNMFKQHSGATKTPPSLTMGSWVGRKTAAQ